MQKDFEIIKNNNLIRFKRYSRFLNSDKYIYSKLFLNKKSKVLISFSEIKFKNIFETYYKKFKFVKSISKYTCKINHIYELDGKLVIEYEYSNIEIKETKIKDLKLILHLIKKLDNILKYLSELNITIDFETLILTKDNSWFFSTLNISNKSCETKLNNIISNYFYFDDLNISYSRWINYILENVKLIDGKINIPIYDIDVSDFDDNEIERLNKIIGLKDEAYRNKVFKFAFFNWIKEVENIQKNENKLILNIRDCKLIYKVVNSRYWVITYSNNIVSDLKNLKLIKNII